MENVFHQEHFFHRVSMVIGLVVFLLLVSQSSGLFAESIEEGARREGKVMFYSHMTAPNNQTLLNAFQKKYPFIKAEVYRSSMSGLLSKALAEKRMGQPIADVLSTGGIWGDLFKKEGLMGRYISPETKFIHQGFVDPEGYWTTAYTSYFTFLYNTKMAAKKDVPKTYEDLLYPRWKGKIGLSTEDVEWFIGMMDFLGEEKGRQFMKRLAEQDLILRSGRTLILSLMVAGEFPLSLGAVQTMLEQQKAGAPIDMLPFTVPTLTALRLMGIHANAPHPNAAKLFIDFILSKDGQSILTQQSRHPVRVGIPVDPVVEKIMRNLFLIKPRNAEMVEGYKKEWDKIFKRR